ncbi:MAG: type II toxin-antitoxin system PemK/MazF family toxin [Candidatus Taylorbacteria bacterium]|nr:type II toxin-antitoxin system PemK/MazF family toxin [Candidatus Taylorbacteria bacterium]
MNSRNFDGWNMLKKDIDIRQSWPHGFNEGEIWWASIGLNVGDEEDGKNIDFERPVLIIRRFNNRVAIIVPITSSNKGSEYHSRIGKVFAIVSQIRLISTKRLNRYFRQITKEEFETVRRDLISAIFTYF